MAATRLIRLHVNKGRTLAGCLKDRIDYAENPDKTEDGTYLSSYHCDPKTAADEFLLSKRMYEQYTGRNNGDIIAYQIRQSFRPGEVSAEEANQIGYDLAMSFTKGRHAFIVATHTDRAHIHNHIIYDATTLDCRRKFQNFFLSSLAIQRISDLFTADTDGFVPVSELAKGMGMPEKMLIKKATRAIRKGTLVNCNYSVSKRAFLLSDKIGKNYENGGGIPENKPFVGVNCPSCAASLKIRANTVGICPFCGKQLIAQYSPEQPK